MLVLRWTEDALDDLDAILAYIDDRDADAANRLHVDIVATTKRMTERPYLYRAGRVSNTREAVVRPNYLLVYRVTDDSVDVLRVLHTSRQYP